MKSKVKKQPMFAVRIKTDKPKIDWSKFVKAKKKDEYVTSGSLLERAVYEFMEREGWDVESQQFIDFNDDDIDELNLKHMHTHIDPTSIEEIVDPVEKTIPEIQESKQEHSNKNDETKINAANENTEQTRFIKVKSSLSEDLFTYAFCKLCGDLTEVHYDHIEQLSLPFFKTKDNRAVINKSNILIGNQCVVRKFNDKKWYKVLPGGIQRFTTKNIHLDEILEKEIESDFLEALRP